MGTCFLIATANRYTVGIIAEKNIEEILVDYACLLRMLRLPEPSNEVRI